MATDAAGLGPARVTRLLVAGWAFHLKSLSLSTFFILTSAIQPVIFASIAFYMFRAGGHAPTLLYAAIGAGLMGIWSTTLFGSGGSIQWQRFQGTLELLVAAPVPFALVLVPLTLATATIGIYSLTATLLWGWLLFDIRLRVVHFDRLACPRRLFISNLFYFLMLLLCGVNVPLDALPGSLAAVGRALPLTHGIEAAREVAAGAPLRAVDHLIAQEALVGAAYGVAAYALLRLFEAEGRRRATLETM